MHRNLLLTLLKEYEQNKILLNSPAEISGFNALQSFINKNPDCFLRNLKEGHVTGSSWLLNNTEDKAFLMHHRKMDMWLQPGGHADGDSDILNVAIKEASEESGNETIRPISPRIFDVDVHLVGQNNNDPHYHYDIRFLLKTTSNNDLNINERESLEIGWFSLEEVNNKDFPPSVIRLIQKWQLYEKNKAKIWDNVSQTV